MRVSVQREKVRFASGDTECAAWHYPGTNGGCVIMAGGGAVTKEPGTDPFARRFHDAGFAVLAFDYRRLGESGGQPRQVVAIRDQLADWQAAIDFAADPAGGRPGPARDLGLLALRRPRLPGRGPQPAAGGGDRADAERRRAGRRAQRARHQKPLAMLRFTGRACSTRSAGSSAVRRCWCRSSGQPGTVAVLTTPDGRRRRPALNPGNRVPGLAAGGRRPLGVRASASTGPAGTRPGCGARCWSWSATRTRRRWPSRPSPRRGAHPAASSSGCPAGTTSRSWPGTSGRSRPSWPSCAGICSTAPAVGDGRSDAAGSGLRRASGMTQIELSAGTIDYADTGGDGPVSCCCTGC